MDQVNRNIENWQALYAEGKNDLIYPNDVLVRIGARLFNSKAAITASSPEMPAASISRLA